MFWGTDDNTGSDSREPNNIDHCMLKDSQSGLDYLPACCLSPFSPLLEIGSSKERLGVNSSPCPLLLSRLSIWSKRWEEWLMFFILFSTKLHAGTDFWGFNLMDKILFFPSPFSFGLFSSEWLWKATPRFCLFVN